MTIATLAEVLNPALKEGYAVAGLVTLGWEDMVAYVEAAEAENAPIILQAGPTCRSHTPLPVLGKMFRYLAEQSSVPVVAHLDHGYTKEECMIALDSGFTSLMYDGSSKPLSQNVEETAEIAELAHSANISCEGEIGFVGYANGKESKGTNPAEAALFAEQSRVDAMAISVGNVHLQQSENAMLDEKKINAIDAVTELPLVIHGGSGVPKAQRSYLSKQSSICKFNIGTELRKTFGDALRSSIASNPQEFDRVALLKPTQRPIFEMTRKIIRNLRSEEE